VTRATEPDEIIKLQVEGWKTAVGVQQHFNDIEMKIRALAITLLTAILGAAALAVRDGTVLHVAHTSFSLAAAIILIGFVAWVLFWFVDELWYHRLLMGSVLQGVQFEKALDGAGIAGFGLTEAIGKASPFKFLGWEVHSKHKIRLFYWVIGALLIVVAITLACSDVNPATPKPSTSGTTSVPTQTTGR
jgi:hypothetical protein